MVNFWLFRFLNRNRHGYGLMLLSLLFGVWMGLVGYWLIVTLDTLGSVCALGLIYDYTRYR